VSFRDVSGRLAGIHYACRLIFAGVSASSGSNLRQEGCIYPVTLGIFRVDVDREDHPFEGMLPLKPGTFPPNAIGLYDMSGNVSEWVNDKYLKDYYERSPTKNPRGPDEGQKDIFDGELYRVARGGNFHDFEGNATVSRQRGSETLAAETRGFRCAMN